MNGSIEQHAVANRGCADVRHGARRGKSNFWMGSPVSLQRAAAPKSENLMSVLFNHACRYEVFDRNPIYLVRQSAKRRTPPAILVPSEIKVLIGSLALRERTLASCNQPACRRARYSA
jgi:hypothetical protein